MENIMTRKLTPEEQNKILYDLFGYKAHLVTGKVYDGDGDEVDTSHDLSTLDGIFQHQYLRGFRHGENNLRSGLKTLLNL